MPHRIPVGPLANYGYDGETVLLTQITFPYLLCMCLVALISGVLNSMRRYWVAAAAPIVLNIVLTAAVAVALLIGTAGKPEAGKDSFSGVASVLAIEGSRWCSCPWRRTGTQRDSDCRSGGNRLSR